MRKAYILVPCEKVPPEFYVFLHKLSHCIAVPVLLVFQMEEDHWLGPCRPEASGFLVLGFILVQDS